VICLFFFILEFDTSWDRRTVPLSHFIVRVICL